MAKNKSKAVKLIVYEGRDEVLVCTEDKEATMLTDYGFDTNDRNKDDYDRYEDDSGAVAIYTRMRTDASPIT